MGDKTLHSTNRRWLKAAVATVGAGVLTFGGAVLPAAADEAPDTTFSATTADKYAAAADQTGLDADQLKADEAAGLVHVSNEGFVLYIDAAHDYSAEISTFRDAGPEGAAIPGNPTDGSRPGAPVTVYLDFDGETLEGTNWNDYSEQDSLKFAPASGVDQEGQEEIWAAVAEDYAPFNVNVTTTNPGAEALYKASADDNEYGSHVIITDSYTDVLPQAAGSGGIAWLNGTGSQYLGGALVFTEGTENASKPISEIAAHESGHNFGLSHDGIEGSTSGEYYYPKGGIWGPIMGAAYQVPVSQWSAGAYAGATNTEDDDLAVITNRDAGGPILISAALPDGSAYDLNQGACIASGDSNNPKPGDVWYAVGPNGDCDPAGEQLTLNFEYVDRADYAADEVGNDAANAQALDNEDGSFTATSVIEQTSDVDVFAVTTVGGELKASVDVASISPNLDAKLTVTDADGKVLGEDNPAAERVSASVASGLDASVTVADLPAGTYYIAVDGVGAGDPTTATDADAGGYTEYGSLGNYTLSGTAEPFVTEDIVIETPEDGADVTGGADVDVTGTATPDATVALTVGSKVVTVTADADGNWAGTVKANEYGDTVIVASQSIDGIEIAGTDSVTVTAPPAPLTAPVITAPVDGTSTEDNTPTISGTGVAGATVTVMVTGADGSEVTAEVVVAADGTWTLDVATELANGDYTVIASQTLDGVTSEDSAAVAFTVAVPAGNGGNGNGGDDDDLATTGSDFNAAPFAAAAGALLLVGAGFAGYARRKSLSLDS